MLSINVNVVYGGNKSDLKEPHWQVSYMIVDTLMYKSPPLCKDIYFDHEHAELPYTEASVAFRTKLHRGSVANMKWGFNVIHLIKIISSFGHVDR